MHRVLEEHENLRLRELDEKLVSIHDILYCITIAIIAFIPTLKHWVFSRYFYKMLMLSLLT